MSLHTYIDNEVAAFGEWTSVSFASGGDPPSQMLQDAAYAFPPPERGALGLRASCLEEGEEAYCLKSAICPTPAAGGTVALGYWYKAVTTPGNNSIIVNMWGSGGTFLAMVISSAGYVYPYLYQDGSGGQTCPGFTCTTGRWHYLQVIVTRASESGVADGTASYYVDGLLMGSTGAYENFAKTAGTTYTLQMGCAYLAAGSTYVGDYDEIKVGDALSDIESYVPTPADEDEDPSARRTVVLFRRYDTDSHAVADAAIAAGVPRGQCLGLACTTNENLADYATFQSEVENSITTFLTNNPTIASNCTCFLLARNVPGSFTSGGVKHSATSRLMNFGTAFSSDTANPLYNPATVSRLTKTALSGKYLAARCDGADGATLISRAATVGEMTALTDADTLYSDETAYLASLPCQKLRIETAAMPGGDFSDDAFAFGDTGTPSFGSAGSRVAFADDSADSASGLRTGSAACYTAVNTGAYAAALGCSETAQAFDAESFFEMLRLGGTFAEAVAVAVPYLDSVSVAAGWPLMTAAFQAGGYNIYRGKNGKDNIDYDTPVGYARAGDEGFDLPLAMEPGDLHLLAVRAVSAAGLEETNTHLTAFAQVDGEGQLLPPPLARPQDVVATAIAADQVRMEFSYLTDSDYARPTEFQVFTDHGGAALDLQNPVAELTDVAAGQSEFAVEIDQQALPAGYAVRASLDDFAGPVSHIVRAGTDEATPPRLL